jgi:hypothetical protein
MGCVCALVRSTRLQNAEVPDANLDAVCSDFGLWASVARHVDGTTLRQCEGTTSGEFNIGKPMMTVIRETVKIGWAAGEEVPA